MAGKRIAVLSLFALVALALTVFASSGTSAVTYKVGLGYSLADTTAGANSDTANTIIIAAPDYNYEDSSMFTLNPIEGWSASGDTLPIGAKVGFLAASSTVGLANGACATKLPPNFELHNATTDTSDVLGPADMYWLLKDKNPPTDIPYGADDPNLPDYLEAYPHFLNDALDPDRDGPKPALQPRARYAGHGFVANMNILIQIVVFYPGQLSELGGIYAQMGEAIGPASLVVLNNPVNQEEAPGAISDFCTPLSTITTLYDFTENGDFTGTGEGYESQRNPEAGTGVLGTGTHIARNYSRAERDADGDGIENDLDPCPYDDDTGWNPRLAGTQAGYDTDGDGLPDTCDPTPSTADSDEDDDGYNNRQDVCPLVANGCKTVTCHPVIFDPAWDNQADGDSSLAHDANADLGPNPDSIGDVCDDSDNDGSEDGCGPGTCTDGIDNGAACDDSGVDGKDVLDSDCASAMDDVDSTPWGSNPGTGLFFHSLPWSAVCVPDTNDSDGDGYCDALETTLGSPTNNGPESGAECDDGPEDPSCVNDVDDDGDTNVNDGCPAKDTPEDDACVDALDDEEDVVADGIVNDGCPQKGDDPEIACADDVDDDADTRVNDGCPAVDISEADVDECAEHPAVDDDGDTRVNDGCPAKDTPEDPSCANDIDDDADTIVNDGCPAKDTPEDEATECNDAVDDDGDTNINDGCPSVGIDHDADTVVNDGCPKVGDYIESGAECLNTTDDDSPTPDAAERTIGAAVNDGCPVIGVPESLVIDVTISATGAQPSVNVPQSCNDGIDNDGDGKLDAVDNDDLGCDPADDSYATDPDYDGHNPDNCPTGWNPEQTNTDVVLAVTGTMGNPPVPLLSDADGDVCDDDDDNDGYDDDLEWYMGTDPLAHCPQAVGHDAWPLDQNQNGLINLTGDAIKFAGDTIGKIIAEDPQYRRQDMNGNGLINLTGDAIKYAGATIGSACTP